VERKSKDKEAIFEKAVTAVSRGASFSPMNELLSNGSSNGLCRQRMVELTIVDLSA